MKELYKDIKGHKDYQISTLGDVKSFKSGKSKILKYTISNAGYKYVIFTHGGKKRYTKFIHQLVAEVFLNHITSRKIVINHKDFNKLNNNLDNLEIVTARENSNRKHLKSASEYVGVTKLKGKKPYISRIVINGERIYLGRYINGYLASLSYQQKLRNL